MSPVRLQLATLPISNTTSSNIPFCGYSKTCLKRPLKKDKTKVLTENGSLINVESIAECSKGSSGHLKIDKTKVLMENGSLMMVESIAEYSKVSSDHCKIDKTKVLMEKVD